MAFADCDATGQYAPGKEQPILRSKIAVARFLERDGMSTEVRFVSFRFVSFRFSPDPRFQRLIASRFKTDR